MDCTVWRKLLGWLIIALPVVSAFDCNSLLCNDIDNSDLPPEEKEYLKLNSLYTNSYYPDHSFIHQWNTAINTDNAPENVKDYQFAKGVWFKMFAVMPSVSYNGTLFVPDNVEILSGYGYHIELPANYFASDYPDTEDGDCKRLYTLANNNYFGDNKLKAVMVDSDTTLTTYFNLDVDVRVEHYRWDSYCCRWDSKGLCRTECHDCEYDYTETQSDRIRLSDYVDVKYYSSFPSAEFKLLDTNIGVLQSDTSVMLSTDTSFYGSYKYFFTVNYTAKPYYFLTLNAEDINEESFDKLYKTGGNLIIPSLNDCKVKAWNYFYTAETECDTSLNLIDLGLSTDKLSYNINETIKVSIFPSDLLLNVTYGDESRFAAGYTEFEAKRLTNKIRVSYGYKSKEKIVYIKEHDNFIRAWNIALFVLINMFFYRILKHYFRWKDG